MQASRMQPCADADTLHNTHYNAIKKITILLPAELEMIEVMRNLHPKMRVFVKGRRHCMEKTHLAQQFVYARDAAK